MRIFGKIGLLALALILLGLPVSSGHAATDPAANRIEIFNATLLDTMKNAQSLGIKGRYNKLAPVIDQTFDLRAMTSLAVGSYWATFSEEDRKKVVSAFRDYTISNYAHNFDGHSGQRFETNPEIITRDNDKVVRTQIVKQGDKPIALTYRMRESGGNWKVVDVYYLGSISQLAMQRSEFSATLASGGADGLVAKLGELSANLMKGKK